MIICYTVQNKKKNTKQTNKQTKQTPADIILHMCTKNYD